MNENEVKVFTVEEANELTPVLTKLIHELHAKRDEVADTEVQADAVELIAGSAAGGAPKEEVAHLVDKHKRLVVEFYEVVDEIHSFGCFLKDADLGLIDFYGVVDGRMVYLCWRLGEAEVGHWHEISQGYSSRQPL